MPRALYGSVAKHVNVLQLWLSLILSFSRANGHSGVVVAGCATKTPWSGTTSKPLAKGGLHCLANLRPACRACNAQKNARWPL